MATSHAVNRRIAAEMATRAESLLAALSTDQRDQALWDFDHGERRLWFYTPTDADGDGALGLPFLWRGRFDAALDTMLAELQSKLEASLGGTSDELSQLSFSTRPKGVAASSLNGEQRGLMRDLLLTYVGRIADDLADAEMARVDAGFDELHFLWAGSMTPGEPHYYRVQGLDLLVEYDNAQRGGNHVHAVWRDLRSDFGGDPLAAHYVGAPRSHGHDAAGAREDGHRHG